MLSDQGLDLWQRDLVNPYGRKGSFHRIRQQSYGSVLLDEYPDYYQLRQSTWSYRTRQGYDPRLETPQGILNANEVKNRRPHDNGHEFKSIRVKAFASHKDYFVRATGGGYYKGPLILERQPLGSLGNLLDHDTYYGEPDLTHASHALRTTIPNKSAENLAQALLELVVDLPRVPLSMIGKTPKNFKDLARNSADEYLNQAFAWSPLASDVLKTVRAVIKSKEILDQYMRDSGRNVRRSFDYQPEVISSSTKDDEIASSLNNLSWSTNGFTTVYNTRADSLGVCTTTIETTRKEWFRGAFTYYTDEGSTLIDKINLASQKAQKLLGVKLNLETLWELAPWSWLADWFTNIGDIIAINSAISTDNLVLRYGYFMQTYKTNITVVHPGVNFIYGGNTGPISQSMEFITKERIRATPYGFGLSTDGFTPLQWAILGALGLTKSPHKMWWG
uniref:Uncharacterized protein n=2 Tax=Leviviricetes TaxID=2842243 RepID=A0A514D7K1_9VIRU|nr:MAG: hypothetical protein H1RhizoLitter1328_000001 [Leviviridae sp.]